MGRDKEKPMNILKRYWHLIQKMIRALLEITEFLITKGDLKTAEKVIENWLH
ncbi:MAG: hypothetical protein KIIPBIDF_01792 [Candidatus Methanoperedenaceae archaeon GB50]|nr:MAG: hypothetical protein KIIPBIDF_01792 [Candidatus Methanoperedenaceae archaeon GB50]